MARYRAAAGVRTGDPNVAIAPRASRPLRYLPRCKGTLGQRRLTQYHAVRRSVGVAARRPAAPRGAQRAAHVQAGTAPRPHQTLGTA